MNRAASFSAITTAAAASAEASPALKKKAMAPAKMTSRSHVTEETLTDIALRCSSDIPDARLRQVMTALVKHAHAFVREIEPTQARMGRGDRFPNPDRADEQR